MTALIILIAALILVALILAFTYGYTKGVHDLTKEIDEGIEKLKKDKSFSQWTYYDSLREENDSD